MDRVVILDDVLIRQEWVQPAELRMSLEIQGSLTMEAGSRLQLVGSLDVASVLTADSSSINATALSAESLSLVKASTISSFSSTDTDVYSLEMDVAGSIVVDATSKIDVSGQGYLPGHTTRNTTVNAATGSWGGSYGGLGGGSGVGATNAVYGDFLNPEHWGSGGGGLSGGRGGGLVRITADGLVMDGKLLANGSNVTSSGGGGSGGGVDVAVNRLVGVGEIGAKGGTTSNAPGGGGRVAVYGADLSGFNVTRITAQAGDTRQEQVRFISPKACPRSLSDFRRRESGSTLP